MDKKVRMADIAQRLGVSTVTVSKALAGKDGVSEAVRLKIRQTASEMGYQTRTPDRESLEGQTVGVLIHERFLSKGQSFYLSLYERVVASLSRCNMYGLLESVAWGDEESRAVPRLVQNDRVQSLIVVGSMASEYLTAVQGLGLPVVQLDAYDAHAGLDTVISDGYYGMYRMTNYLIRRGHRNIAYLGRVGAASSITDRYFGYCRALQENGIPVRDDWRLTDRDDHGQFQLELPEEMPTAFACNCDAAAYHLSRLLEDRGVKVPEDVSIVSFDDDMYSNLASPRITTYGVNMDGMAEACVEQLRDRYMNPDKELEFKVITGYLREKDSVLPR